MVLPSRNIVIAALAGVVVGAFGYKLYQDHKDQILTSLDSLKNRCSKGGSVNDLSEEELQAQKEHLEDLLAEQKAAKKA